MRKEKPIPEAVYVSLTGWTFDDRRTISVGARLLGTDEAVKKHPEWFIRDGATDSERIQAMDAAGLFRRG